jgi:hypothetical protein
MKKIIAVVAVLLTTACTDPYGRVDPLATGLAVGAGALAVGALGYAAGQNSAPRYHNHYAAPRYHSSYGSNPPYAVPRHYHAPRHGYYR